MNHSAPKADRKLLPRLLMCEGFHDACFFERLIAERGLPHFTIRFSGGKDKFAKAIGAIRLESPQAFRALTDILIVADNDDDPKDRFTNVCDQINELFGKYSAPKEALLKIPLKGTKTSIAIMMVPAIGESGQLERLCEPAARGQDNGVADKVDTFMGLMHAEKWDGETRRNKTWLRVNLAARAAKNPFVTLQQVFGDPRHKDLIPISHKAFDPIANWLKSY